MTSLTSTSTRLRIPYRPREILRASPLRSVVLFATIDSTNRYAKYAHVPTPALVIAQRQSKGYGRRGRTWKSEAGKSILFSLALSPPFPEDHALLSLYTGYVVCAACAKHVRTPLLLKYPNDIYAEGEKLAGILVETVYNAHGTPSRIVVGVGANLSYEGEGTLTPRSTSLCAHGFTGDVSTLLADIVSRFFEERAYLSRDRALFIERLRPLNALYGKRVRYVLGEVEGEGRAGEITAEGCLRIEGADGVPFASRTLSEVRVCGGDV